MGKRARLRTLPARVQAAPDRLRTAPPTPSRQERRRFYDKRWWRDGIRPAHLAVNPLCVECEAEGKVVPATQVDHRDGNPENNDPANLVSMCQEHHSRKTVLHDGGFGQPLRRKT